MTASLAARKRRGGWGVASFVLLFFSELTRPAIYRFASKFCFIWGGDSLEVLGQERKLQVKKRVGAAGLGWFNRQTWAQSWLGRPAGKAGPSLVSLGPLTGPRARRASIPRSASLAVCLWVRSLTSLGLRCLHQQREIIAPIVVRVVIAVRQIVLTKGLKTAHSLLLSPGLVDLSPLPGPSLRAARRPFCCVLVWGTAARAHPGSGAGDTLRLQRGGGSESLWT